MQSLDSDVWARAIVIVNDDGAMGRCHNAIMGGNTPDFSLSVGPGVITIAQGSSGQLAANVRSSYQP